MLNIIKDILSFSFYTILLLVSLYFGVLLLVSYYHYIGSPVNEWLSTILESLSASMKAQNVNPIEHFINFFYGVLILIAFCIVNFPALVIMGAVFDRNPIQIVQVRKA